jgi:ADP-dependent NAD(P)H-hydrate dehydratase / NAD(P)H-hydrate epimerase
MMLLVTAAEMRALDRHVIEEIGVPGVVLMESAGRSVVDVLATLVDVPRTRFVVYAGRGNNGGDGFVVARHLANRGAAVDVILVAPAARVTGDAHTHLSACKKSGVDILDGSTPEALRTAAARGSEADVVIDALFGTGLTREVTDLPAEAIGHVNAHQGLTVAIDVPSGLDADRGVPLGACVRADHTVTFAFAKRGLVTAPGFTFSGTLHVVDIGIPERLARARGVTAELLGPSVLQRVAAPRDPLGHKGTHGHLLVVAGSEGKTGAALLCGGAALRAGAGLVTVASPDSVRSAIDGRVPELMTAGYGDERKPDWDALEAHLPGKRAVAVGPGMPTGAAMRGVLAELCRSALARGLGLVLDADALNHLAAEQTLLDPGSEEAARWRLVLTPHPGEAARLLGKDTREVQSDRVASAQALAARYGAVVVLKGARTIIAAPDGRLAVNPTGNPGLGTGGTGDVLTGILGALLAQGLGGFEAACAAAYWHGAAGDRVAEEHGETGLMAGDVVEALPGTLRR